MAVEASRATNYRTALKRSQPVTKSRAGKKTSLRAVFAEVTNNLPENVIEKDKRQLRLRGRKAKVEAEKTSQQDQGLKVYGAKSGKQRTPGAAAAKECKRRLHKRQKAKVELEPVECEPTAPAEAEVKAEPIEDAVKTETAEAANTAAAAALSCARAVKEEANDCEVPSTPTDIYNCPYETPEIMAYLSDLETKFRLRSDYMQNDRGHVKPYMRAILVDWMISVQAHYRMSQLTLQQAVTFLDLILSRRSVKTTQLQLIGITCLFIAAKYSERFPPEVRDLCRLTEDAYKPRQVLTMERVLLNTLQFELFAPEPSTFLDRLLQASSDSCREHKKVALGARYFLDLMLTDVELARLLPSMRAAASLNLARQMVLGKEEGWSTDLVFYHGYTESCMKSTVDALAALLESTHKGSRYQGAYKKYELSTYGRISKVFKYA